MTRGEGRRETGVAVGAEPPEPRAGKREKRSTLNAWRGTSGTAGRETGETLNAERVARDLRDRELLGRGLAVPEVRPHQKRNSAQGPKPLRAARGSRLP